MFTKFRISIALLLAIPALFSLTISNARAEERSFDLPQIDDGRAAAKNLEQLRNRFHPIAWLGGNLPAGAGSAGSLYEVKAVLEGRVGCGDSDTLLLQLNANSIDADVPHNYTPAWLDDRAQVRLIVSDNVDSESSTASYVVVAAAPESEIAAMDAPALRAIDRYGSSRMQTASVSRLCSSANLPKGHPACLLPDNILAIYPYYRNSIAHYNPRLDDQTLDKITTSILAYSKYYQVDPRLIMAMIIAESGFDPQSTSRDGAIGLGQLMPGTAAGLGVSNPYDPVQNVGAAVKILSDHVNQYGGATRDGLVPMNTLLLTMAAYNAGGGAVAKYHGVPPYRETQNYVRKVSDLYRRMCGG